MGNENKLALRPCVVLEYREPRPVHFYYTELPLLAMPMGKKSKQALGRMILVIIIVVIILIAASAVVGLTLLRPGGGGLKYGTSSVSLSPNSQTVSAGSTASVSYSVSLASGTKWGTAVSVSNSSSFQALGITFSGIGTMSDPPYSGTLSISTSSGAKPGTYYVPISATGDDPSSQPVILTLTVNAPSSSSGGTSSSATTSTTTSTTAGYSTSTSSHGGYGGY